MKDDFEEIRAERDRPFRYKQETKQYAGLWKQIALGIVVGYCALGLLSVIGWFIAMQVMSSGLSFNLP
jgi:ABC-type transport system involved in cytochrome bd biosynthesis fused ATPase/permease subunit